MPDLVDSDSDCSDGEIDMPALESRYGDNSPTQNSKTTVTGDLNDSVHSSDTTIEYTDDLHIAQAMADAEWKHPIQQPKGATEKKESLVVNTSSGKHSTVESKQYSDVERIMRSPQLCAPNNRSLEVGTRVIAALPGANFNGHPATVMKALPSGRFSIILDHPVPNKVTKHTQKQLSVIGIFPDDILLHWQDEQGTYWRGQVPRRATEPEKRKELDPDHRAKPNKQRALTCSWRAPYTNDEPTHTRTLQPYTLRAVYDTGSTMSYFNSVAVFVPGTLHTLKNPIESFCVVPNVSTMVTRGGKVLLRPGFKGVTKAYLITACYAPTFERSVVAGASLQEVGLWADHGGGGVMVRDGAHGGNVYAWPKSPEVL